MLKELLVVGEMVSSDHLLILVNPILFEFIISVHWLDQQDVSRVKAAPGEKLLDHVLVQVTEAPDANNNFPEPLLPLSGPCYQLTSTCIGCMVIVVLLEVSNRIFIDVDERHHLRMESII